MICRHLGANFTKSSIKQVHCYRYAHHRNKNYKFPDDKDKLLLGTIHWVGLLPAMLVTYGITDTTLERLFKPKNQMSVVVPSLLIGGIAAWYWPCTLILMVPPYIYCTKPNKH